jgi:phosphoglycolate phosphatase
MTAAVTYGYGSREEIIKSEPDIIFETFSELTTFLESKTAPNKRKDPSQ